MLNLKNLILQKEDEIKVKILLKMKDEKYKNRLAIGYNRTDLVVI